MLVRNKIKEKVNYFAFNFDLIGYFFWRELKIDWWFGHSFLCVFEKNKPSIISVSNERIFCDICHGRCKRGRAGKGMNDCTNKPIIIND